MCVKRAIGRKHFATLSDKTYTKYIQAYAPHDSYGRSTICSFKQESTVRLLIVYLEKGCFLTESINRVITVAIEAELTNIW
jgi:hypothetical protein